MTTTRRTVPGVLLWAFAIWPAYKLGEAVGWVMDRRNAHNFGQVD